MFPNKETKKYYKIQKWNKDSLSWIDKQKSYSTVEEVKKDLPTSVKSRIMVVEGKNRYLLE